MKRINPKSRLFNAHPLGSFYNDQFGSIRCVFYDKVR